MYCHIQKLLGNSSSDKESNGDGTPSHSYGFFYELLINSMYLKQKRPLNILEIGVSLFSDENNGGDLEVFSNLPIISKMVGVDISPYNYNLQDNAEVIRASAYCHETLSYLQNKGDLFDIIIDDGSHDTNDQVFFLENYDILLSQGGYLICEDVRNMQLVQEYTNKINTRIIEFVDPFSIQSSPYNPSVGPHNHRCIIKIQ